MSKTWGIIGAWAPEAELEEDEEREASGAAAASATADTQSFPSLREAAIAKAKKNKMTHSHSEFAKGYYNPGSGGSTDSNSRLTHDEMLRLPTGPKERSAEEIQSGSLGGGFSSYGRPQRPMRDGDDSCGGNRRSYGGFDDEQPRRGPSSRASEMDQSYIADEIGNWEMNRKPFMSLQSQDSGRQNRYGGLGSGGGGAGKKPIPTRSFTFGSGFRNSGPEPDGWTRGSGGGDGGGFRDERTRLNLDPPKSDFGANDTVTVKTDRLNPFGAARPREQMLAEKGLDWKKLEMDIENKKASSHPTSSHSSRPSSAQSSRSESQGLLRLENVVTLCRPNVNRFGNIKPREVLLEELDQLLLEIRRIDRPESEEEKRMKEELDHLISTNANMESPQVSDGDPPNLLDIILHKDQELETLILDLDGKVQLGQKPTERPGSGAGRGAAFPERPPSQSGSFDDTRLHDASKEEFESNEKLVDRPPRLPVIEELKSLDSNVVQLKSDDEFVSQRSEHRTDVSIISHSSPGESFKLLPENSSIKHESASFDSDSYDLINLFYPPDILHDISSPISLKNSEISQLEELPPRLHSLKISECPMLKLTPPRLRIVDYMQLHDASKDEFESNEKVVDQPPRLPVIEELKSLDSNVVQLKSADEFASQRSEHRTDVSITSHISSRESFKFLPEDSSIKHEGASSDSDGDDLISIWYSPDSLHDISSPISLKVSEISQLEELPPRLHSLKIEGCDALKSVPREVMCGSPHLQHLYIIDCCYLELFQEGLLPVALKSLYIHNCRKLDFLSLAETMHEHGLLEHLCMGSSCDSLRCFPLTFFPKLRSLSIWDSANFDSISITKNHMSLHAIEIRDCHKLLYFPKGGLLTPNLTSILLSNCKNLKVLPDQLYRLTSLQSLLINECPELDSIPEGGFPCSLDLLRITSCNKLTPCTDWGMDKLNNLSCFEIEGGCRDLESFPEEKLLPSNLNFLRISRASNLKFLDYKGLEHLKSLETLEINCCDKLRSLPEKDLPSSLTFLYIKECPLLESTLQNRRGKEWCKISHIPNIQID